MRPALLLALSLALASASALVAPRPAREKRAARSSVQSCSVSPPGIGDKSTPAPENGVIEIKCRTDTAYNLCHVEHVDPKYVNQGNSGSGSQYEQYRTTCDIAGGGGSTSKQCDDDTRITMSGSGNECNVRISSPKAEDTGEWKITVGEVQSGGTMQSNSKTVDIYTFNESKPIIQEQRNSGTNDQLTSLDLWYDYDEDEEETVSSSQSSWKTRVEIKCNDQGGLPEPELQWMINRDERNLLNTESIFRISTSEGDRHDPNGYFTDFESTLTFDVNYEFLRYLQDTHQININPSGGKFDFDLQCRAKQGKSGEFGQQDYLTRVTVHRVEFTDTLRGETIGMIVGIVLAVLLLIVVCLVLVFLKATERCCFADDSTQSYGYKDPKRARPANAQH